MARSCVALLSGLMLLVALSADTTRAAQPDKDAKGTAKVSGVLVFREKVEFLADTMIEVTIQEDNPAPARPETVLGKQVIRDARMAPVVFNVEYNPADVRKGTRYVLRGRVFTNRGTLYVSSPDASVLTATAPSRDLRVFMVPVRGGATPSR